MPSAARTAGNGAGKDLQDATGGIVTKPYVTHLGKGRIENPGYEKLRAIAQAMGFPPELWFEDAVESFGDVAGVRPHGCWIETTT